MNYLKRLLHEDDGQDMVEYGLLASFISIVAVLALMVVGARVNITYKHVGSAVDVTGSNNGSGSGKKGRGGP